MRQPVDCIGVMKIGAAPLKHRFHRGLLTLALGLLVDL